MKLLPSPIMRAIEGEPAFAVGDRGHVERTLVDPLAENGDNNSRKARLIVLTDTIAILVEEYHALDAASALCGGGRGMKTTETAQGDRRGGESQKMESARDHENN